MSTKKNISNEVRFEMSSKSVNESFARYAVASFVSQLDPCIEELTDIRTAVSEAVTNCIVHAYRNQGGIIYIKVVYYDDRTIQIQIRDKGCGIQNVKTAMEPLYTTDDTGERSGMGFAIMGSFMDSIRVTSKPNKGTIVTMVKRLKFIEENNNRI